MIRVTGEEDVDDSEQFYYSFWGKTLQITFSIGKLAYYMGLIFKLVWSHVGIRESTKTVSSHFILIGVILSSHVLLSSFKVWLNYKDIFVNFALALRWPSNAIFWRAFGSQWLAFLFTQVFMWQKGNIEIHFWFITDNLLGNVSESKNDYMVFWWFW